MYIAIILNCLTFIRYIYEFGLNILINDILIAESGLSLILVCLIHHNSYN